MNHDSMKYELEKILPQISIFRHLTGDEIKKLSQVVTLLEVPAGHLLLREGEIGDRFFVIIEGEVEIIKALDTPEASLLGIRKTGDYLGEMSLLNWDGKRTASARGITSLRLIVITRKDFTELLKQQPELVYELMREMTNRLTNSQEQAIQVLHKKNYQLEQAYEALKAAQAQLIEKERLEKELQVAREIQLSILPRTLPQVKGFEFGALIVPARAVGGDFFDIFPLGNDRMGVVIGDVTDKGVPAAIYMAQTRALFRAIAGPGISPIQTLRLVNQILLDTNDSGMFVTVLFGNLDLLTGRIEYARAGHEIPLLMKSSGIIQEIPHEGGFPLGIIEDPLFDQQTVQIHPGELLLLYTDGVTDGLNLAADSVGTEQLQIIMEKGKSLQAQDFCNHISQSVSEQQKGESQFDDVTIFAIKAIE